MNRVSLVPLLVLAAACSADENLGRTYELGDTLGPARWSVSFGTAGDDRAATIAFAPDDDVFVGGWFASTTDFGSGPIDPGTQGCFLTRREADTGRELWTHAMPAYDCVFASVAPTSDGGVIATGAVTGADVLDFGGQTLDVPANESQLFVVSYDADGALRWLWSLDPASRAAPGAVAVGPDDLVYLVGTFTGALDLGAGPTQPGGCTQDDCVAVDGFLIALDATGQPRWSRTFDAPRSAMPRNVAIASGGDVAVGLTIGGAITLDATTLVPPGYEDAVYARFHPDGTLAWGAVFGPSGEAAACAGLVAFDSADRLVAATDEGCGDGMPRIRVLGVDGAEVWESAPAPSDYTRALAVTAGGDALVGGMGNGLFVDASDADGHALDSLSYDSGGPNNDVTDALATSPSLRVALAAQAFGPLDLGRGPLAPGMIVAVLDPFDVE